MIDGLCQLIRPAERPVARIQETALRKELGLGDLVLAQVLCVVGSSWVGVAAKLGRAHVVFWLAAMLAFYVPLAAVVIYLNRLMPLEGGLYQWAKAGIRRDGGLPDRVELVGVRRRRSGRDHFRGAHGPRIHARPRGAWLAASRWATLILTGAVMAGITAVAVHGLDIGKWLHNAGSVMILLAYVILLGLPVWALMRGTIPRFEPLPWELPKARLVQPGDLRADDGGRAQRLRICRDTGRRMPRRGAHHRAIGGDLGAGDRGDVHPRHQHGADLR